MFSGRTNHVHSVSFLGDTVCPYYEHKADISTSKTRILSDKIALLGDALRP